MNKSKFLLGLVCIVYLIYIFFQMEDEVATSVTVKTFILPLITLLYFLTVSKKSMFFALFLVFYTISDLLILVEATMSNTVSYYLGNTLYILAYSFLLIEICKSVCVLQVVKNFKMHLIVLTLLNIYIVYVLQVIVNPHVGKTNQFYIEIVYNVVMLLVLSLSLLNYFYRDNIKSLYLFLGSLCIVFSEVIWVAYIYISASSFLNIISTSLYVVAFYFFYLQSKIYKGRRSKNAHFLTN